MAGTVLVASPARRVNVGFVRAGGDARRNSEMMSARSGPHDGSHRKCLRLKCFVSSGGLGETFIYTPVKPRAKD